MRIATIDETVTVQIFFDAPYPIAYPNNKREHPINTTPKRKKFLGSNNEFTPGSLADNISAQIFKPSAIIRIIKEKIIPSMLDIQIS